MPALLKGASYRSLWFQVGAASRSGRGRRSISSTYSNSSLSDTNLSSPIDPHHKELDDQLILMVPLEHTKPQYQILRLQPSLKHMVKYITHSIADNQFIPKTIHYKSFQNHMKYIIKKGNSDSLFQVNYQQSPASLHFRRKIKKPRTYDLEIMGYSTDPEYYHFSRKDPFTLRLRLIITN